ncbi:hypothetical protein KSS87_021371 [Heliosperma pusillum]|nr:hypothetical protein KSS87_021371 [Heliosperma pusillum]
METTPSSSSSSLTFTRLTDDSAFTQCRHHVHTTIVHMLSTHDHPCIFTSSSANPAVYRHPLTSKPHSFNSRYNIDVSRLDRSTLTFSYHFDSPHHVDKLLVCYGSRDLTSFPCRTNNKDNGVIYAVTRHMSVIFIHVHPSTGTISMDSTVNSSSRFGWRKRFVCYGGPLYLVVRVEEEVFELFVVKREMWLRENVLERVWGFEGKKVLFMAKDHYFFLDALRTFPGKKYRSCIVFSEAAFPQYGNGCWEFTKTDNVRKCEDDIGIFCFDNGLFTREGENTFYPKIDWWPTAWNLNAASPLPAQESQSNLASECHSKSERKPDENERVKSASRNMSEGGVQSDLKNLDRKVKGEQEEIEYAFSDKGQDKKTVDSGSDSQDHEDGRMQCYSNGQDKDEDMHSKANIEEGTPEVMTLSLSTGEEVGRTLAIEEGTSGKNIISSITKPSTSSTTQSHKSDSGTTKFEGFDIRSDIIPTLKKIWLKHGNIVKDSIVHNSNIIGTSLEALAIMVRQLEENSAQSLSDSQADYLSSTLSDLKCIRFEVDWLSSFVEKALNIRKSRSLVESLNNLKVLSSQAKERRAILFDELTKLDAEETKRKQEMEKVAKMISFYGQAMFDEPVGAGLTFSNLHFPPPLLSSLNIPTANITVNQMETPNSNSPSTPSFTTFTRLDDDSAFKTHHRSVYSASIYLLRPPQPNSSTLPCVITRESIINNNYTYILRHPLTFKPYSFNFPRNIDFSQLDFTTLATFSTFQKPYLVDKLLVLPLQYSHPNVDVDVVKKSTMLALYGGGQLMGCPRFSSYDSDPWVNLSNYKSYTQLQFDDIIVFKGEIYAVERAGYVRLINNATHFRKLKLSNYIVNEAVTVGIGPERFGWRKRFALDGYYLHLVVRYGEKLFEVYLLRYREKGGYYWDEVMGLGGNKVLFMGKDYCFFRKVSKEFLGKEYGDCIVFSEAAFPQYGDDCWQFTQIDGRQFSEEDIGVFRVSDRVFAREGEDSCFPKIDWSHPAWVFNVSPVPAAEFQKHTVSESSGKSERNPDIADKNDEKVQSELKDTKSKDEEVQEEMETDFGCLNKGQNGVESNLGNRDQDGGKMQCDSNSQEKEVVELRVNAITHGGASLREDVCHASPSVFRPEPGTTVTQTPSLSATEEEFAGTLPSLNGGNSATEEETLRNNITELVPRACTFSTTKRQRSDSATAKFEGFDVRPDLVPTLQKIWQKHGNILEYSAVRSYDMISRGLESLATMVLILGDNSAMSLSDTQANYLVSTLSDLGYIRFKVDWLIPFVEKAEKLHKSKPLLESLNTLNQLSSQAQERRPMLLDELTKFDVELNKLKEKTAKVSKMICFYGQVKLDEPLGTGLL